MINLSTARQLYELINQQEARSYENRLVHRLYDLESRYTFFVLKKIFKSTHYETIHIPLKKLLETRWNRIAHSDINYCQNHNSPINTVCIAIAKALANQNTSYLVFLMPSLAYHHPASYLTSSYEDDIQPHECILNDDATRLIHIPDVLSFSKVDGILKHNYLSENNTVKRLTESEQTRLVRRHPSISECLNAIHHRLTFTRFGNTTGAALRRLIDGLNDGGEHNGHDELNAGESANLAILEFARYLETLDTETKNHVLALGLFDRFTTHVPEVHTIGGKWKLLSEPRGRRRATFSDLIYCVEMIARELEDILAEHPGLYETTSCKDTSINTLAALSNDIETALTQVEQSLADTTFDLAYGKEGEKILFHRLVDQLSRDKTFHLTQNEVVYIAIRATDKFRIAQSSCRRLLASILQHNTPAANESLRMAIPSRCRQLLETHQMFAPSNQIFESHRRDRNVDDDDPHRSNWPRR